MSKLQEFKILINLLLLTALLAGCSANGLVIRYFYGEMDDKLYDRILAYATFTETQKEQIRKSVEKYSSWHKQNELPRYENFLDQIATQISAGELTSDMVLTYFEQARGFAKTSFEHSPFFNSAEFLKSLSDQQIEEIQNKFARQDDEFQRWLKKRQEEDDNGERLKQIIKNTRRITDISLNNEQQQIVKDGLSQIKSDPLNRHKVYNRWQAGFIQILDKRHEQKFTETVSEHIATYQNLIKSDSPKRYENNEKIAAHLIIQIVASLDEKQKLALQKRIEKTRETLISITND